jgi:hypothetical protein
MLFRATSHNARAILKLPTVEMVMEEKVVVVLVTVV